jgi:hypothetical protein
MVIKMISFKNLSKPSVDSELKLLLVIDTTELSKRKLIVEKVVFDLDNIDIVYKLIKYLNLNLHESNARSLCNF